MSERLYEYTEITDLKDMLEKTKDKFPDRPAYKVKNPEGKYYEISHFEVRNMINYLGTALIELGLKDKRIAVIGENRYEWEIAYLAITCGTGIVVPLDKSLPKNELISLIERSEVEAIFYSNKYEEILKSITARGIGKLKHLISMDLVIHENGIYSEKELIQKGQELVKRGDRRFIDAKINPKEMKMMLFTSGTTAVSKVVALSHENICTNLMDCASILDVSERDLMLSFLPLHHVFECTVGFLLALYKGSEVVFCEGLRYILQDLTEHKITFMACVPAVYEKIYKNIIKNFEKEGRTEEIKLKIEKYKNASMEEKREVFKEVHGVFGGNVRLLISGAAALDKVTEQGYRNFGINLVQGYGLTETSPVVGVGSNKYYRVGSIGKSVPSVKVAIDNPDDTGMGELVVKGKSIMLGYFQNEEATKEVLRNGWFHTGDLARIDKDGYIFICGRKKSVIVLKNGKNIFPEEMEALVNRVEGVKESLIFGKPITKDENDIKIFTKIVLDKVIIKDAYKVSNDEEIYQVMSKRIKEINKLLPPYKAIRGFILTEEPLLKTTTSKIKRAEEMRLLEKESFGKDW